MKEVEVRDSVPPPAQDFRHNQLPRTMASDFTPGVDDIHMLTVVQAQTGV
jgi:hypothetical protein